MSYEVTATRRRPQGFEQLVGQDFVVSTLKSSLKLGRIAHAYLFSGPRGVGKTSAARILAKALNCEKGPTPDPCGECSQCQEIARGNSLDVIEIDGASNTSVNDIRELKDEVLFAPNSGRYKVYIIDEVHMLSNSAFNALLKTIEEPPPYIVFVFATTEIHKVPATIRSRCQQFNFRLISIEGIKEQLRQVVVEMGIQAEDEALFWIAKEATGSLRDAYTLFDQVASFSDSHITMKQIQEKLGLTGIDAIGELVDLMADGRGGDAMSRAEEILAQGVSIEQLIIDLTEYFRSLLLLKNGIEREGLLGYHPDRFPQKLRDVFSIPQIEYAVEELLSLYRNIRYSLNQRFEIELMLSKLSSLKDHLSSREMMEKIRRLRAEIAGGDSAGGGATVAGAGTSSTGRTVRSGTGPGTGPGPAPEIAGFGRNIGMAESGTAETGQDSTTSHGASETADGGEPSRETGDPSQKAGDPSRELSALREQMRAAEKKSPLNGNEAPKDTPEADSSSPAFSPDASPSPDTGITAGDEDDEEPTLGSSISERRLDTEEIEQIIDGLKQRPSLSSALNKVITWDLRGRSLELSCDTKYSVRKLQQEIAALKPVTEGVLGFPVEINLQVQEGSGKRGTSGGKTDSQVELVTKVFRGTIIEEA